MDSIYKKIYDNIIQAETQSLEVTTNYAKEIFRGLLDNSMKSAQQNYIETIRKYLGKYDIKDVIDEISHYLPGIKVAEVKRNIASINKKIVEMQTKHDIKYDGAVINAVAMVLNLKQDILKINKVIDSYIEKCNFYFKFSNKNIEKVRFLRLIEEEDHGYVVKTEAINRNAAKK